MLDFANLAKLMIIIFELEKHQVKAANIQVNVILDYNDKAKYEHNSKEQIKIENLQQIANLTYIEIVIV